MEHCLLEDPKKTRRKVYVLCGLGGMGKTQLAVEFARRHQKTFSSIFFIDGSSKDSLLQSFIRIFRLLASSDVDVAKKSQSDTEALTDSTPDGVTTKALEWFSLAENNKWLLIYDNVDLEPTDPGGFVLENFFPTRDHGSIVVTTRLASLPVAGLVKRLSRLDSMQAIELLTGTSTAASAKQAWGSPGMGHGTQGKSSALKHMRQYNVNHHWVLAAANLKLVEDLGGLPLAISQAGKLMKSIGVDVSEYLELYKTSKRKVIDMLQPESMPSDPERASIRTTWTTSINILKQRMVDENETGPHRCAYRLLHLFAYFDPTDLDYSLLKNGMLVNNAPAWVSKVFESKLDFYSTAKILLDLSLIDNTNSSGVYSMHRVVFDWLCTYEAHETEPELLNVAAAAIAWACPVSYVPLLWAETQQRLILHANVLGPRIRGHGALVRPVWYTQPSDVNLELAAELWECDRDTLQQSKVYHPIGDIARLLSSGGRAREGLDLIEDSIASSLKLNPEQDISYYALLYEKATILLDMSLISEANETTLEALEGFRRLQNQYWVACTQVLQGCQQDTPEEGIRCFEEALGTSNAAGLSVFYCPGWLAFQNIDNKLQWQLFDTDRRRIHLESVREEAERRGYDLPNAQEALGNLASAYVDLGMKGNAEPLYLRLLEWQVKRHGKDAIQVLPRVQELAWFYFNQGKVESIEYDMESLRLVEMHYGPCSREAVNVHSFLGESYERHGQLSNAREHFEIAWKIHKLIKGLLVTERIVLDGLVRICESLGDKDAMIKYYVLRHGSGERVKGMRIDEADDNSLGGASSTLVSTTTWGSQSETLHSETA
jgi:tetratricopeptide (TPR) repeat protein